MDVTEETFERDVIERSAATPVVVDFWADWCRPCHMLTPVLEQAVAERAPEIQLVKVDIDSNPALAARFSVQGIPAVKAFRNGHVTSQFVGAQPPQRVADFLDALTGPSEADRLADELRESGELPDVVAALDAGDHESALRLLLDGIPQASSDERERIRRIAVALFGELGQEHPLSMRYRRQLATALY